MIKVAEVRHCSQIVNMCREFWKHSGFEETFDASHVMSVVMQCQMHRLLLVVEIDGVVEGFIAGSKSYLLGSKEALTGTELAWWVNPGVREQGWGMRLLSAMEDQARRCGIKYWNMAFMRSSMPDEVKEMYEKAGYTLRETVYSKVL